MPKRPSAQARIRQAALELFGRKGIAGATVQDIAARAHCSQAAIYKYWDGKDALAEDLFRVAYSELLDSMKGQAGVWQDPRKRAEGAAQGFLDYARRRPAEHALLFLVFHTDYVKWIAREVKPSDLVEREIQAGMEAGSIAAGDPAVKTAMILGIAIRLAVFERQKMIKAERPAVDRELRDAVSAILAI